MVRGYIAFLEWRTLPSIRAAIKEGFRTCGGGVPRSGSCKQGSHNFRVQFNKQTQTINHTNTG